MLLAGSATANARVLVGQRVRRSGTGVPAVQKAGRGSRSAAGSVYLEHRTVYVNEGVSSERAAAAFRSLADQVHAEYGTLERTANQSRRRHGKIDLLVIHYTAGGSLDSAVAWFKNPKAQVSAHYVLGTDG